MFQKILYKLWTRSPKTNLYSLVRAPKINQARLEPIWCLSTGRVGSQTLAELAGLSPQLAAYHEPWPYTFGLAKYSYDISKLGGDNLFLNTMIDSVRSRLIAESGGKNYIETSPQMTFLAPALLNQYPDSKFIHVIRNPGDVILSGMRRDWYGGQNRDRTRIVPHTGKYNEKWNSMSQFEKNVWLWCETNRWIMNFCDDLPNCMFLKSEDIFSGSMQIIRGFFTFCGVECPSEKRIEQILKLKLNAQKIGEYPAYQNWTPSQKRFLYEVGEDVIDRLDYKL